MEGHEIFTLKNKMMTIHKSFYAEDAKDNDLFQVKGHFSMLSSHSTAHFKNASDDQPVELEIKGDWFDRSASITWGEDRSLTYRGASSTCGRSSGISRR